jgi:hypothetical protein
MAMCHFRFEVGVLRERVEREEEAIEDGGVEERLLDEGIER